MARPAQRLLALGLGVSLSGAAALAAVWSGLLPGKEMLVETLEDPLAALMSARLGGEGPRRNAAVLAEIERLGDHAWAGVYSTSDGMGGWDLALAPGTGFTLYHGTGCGTCSGYDAFGRIVHVEGRELTLAIDAHLGDHGARGGFGVDETLWLVPWRELLFAVPSGAMETFCAAVSDGHTMPDVPSRGERLRRPTGAPDVPDAFRHLLLAEPVDGRITAFVERRRRPELDGGPNLAFDEVYDVDVGSESGLAIGMRLFVDGDPRGGRFLGRVEHVEPHSARFHRLSYGWKGEGAVLVGRAVSTRHPKAEER